MIIEYFWKINKYINKINKTKKCVQILVTISLRERSGISFVYSEKKKVIRTGSIDYR